MEPCGVEPNGYFIKDGVAVIMIIGEIEGHENTGDSIKTTRYDHLIPLMVNLSMDPQIRGFLFLIHTIGCDVKSLNLIVWRTIRPNQPFRWLKPLPLAMSVMTLFKSW